MQGIIRITVFVLLLVGLFILINTKVPSQHVPWRTLNPQAPLGYATKTQLFRVAIGSADKCMMMARDIKSLHSVPADPKITQSVCGWEIARFMEGTETLTLAPGEVSMQCPLTLGSYIWLREVERLAIEAFESPLVKIHHMGTYSCRKQRGNGSGQWSEHSFSNAWDIGGFELADGTLITVRGDWKNGTKAEKKFLRDIRDSACKVFSVVLSPDYNAAHYDHFHVDMGPSRSCR